MLTLETCQPVVQERARQAEHCKPPDAFHRPVRATECVSWCSRADAWNATLQGRATGPWQQKSSQRVQASGKQIVFNAGSIAVLACVRACDVMLTLETDGSQVEAWGPLHWVTIGWRFGWPKPQTSWSEMQVASARHPSPPFAAPLHRHSLPLRAALHAPWLCLYFLLGGRRTFKSNTHPHVLAMYPHTPAALVVEK